MLQRAQIGTAAYKSAITAGSRAHDGDLEHLARSFPPSYARYTPMKLRKDIRFGFTDRQAFERLFVSTLGKLAV
jgi:hypothetical protein